MALISELGYYDIFYWFPFQNNGCWRKLLKWKIHRIFIMARTFKFWTETPMLTLKKYSISYKPWLGKKYHTMCILNKSKWPINLGERCCAFLKYRVQLFAFQLVSFLSEIDWTERYDNVYVTMLRSGRMITSSKSGNTLVLIE